MDLAAVMDAVADRLATITTLRVHEQPPGRIAPPGTGGVAIVSYPEDIRFDQTYGRGMDRMTLPVVLVVGKVSDRAARTALAAFAKGSGATSVKAVLESGTYTAFHEVTVTSVEFDVVTIAATDYMAALFSLDIAGQGS